MQDGGTALMSACHRGHRDVAELLLDRGADVGQATQDGGTALMLACQ
jgi:ankyrin repeat protein